MNGAARAVPDPERSPGAIVRAFIAAWNANDLDRVVAHLHPDVCYHNMPVEPIRAWRDYFDLGMYRRQLEQPPRR